VSRRRLYQLATGLVILALVALVAGYLRRNAVGIEGAYFNRSVGAPAYAGVLNQGFWLFRTDVLYGISVGLALAALATSALAFRTTDSRA